MNCANKSKYAGDYSTGVNSPVTESITNPLTVISDGISG